MRRRTFVAAAGTTLAAPTLVAGQTDPGPATDTQNTQRGSGKTTTAPRTGYALVNGLRMYYELHGPDTGQPLVVLHGAYMTIELMGRLVPGLAESRRVIAVELQGHGHTADVDRPLTYAQLADDTAALLGRLGIGSADVYGYSLGGGVGLQMAIRHSALVRKEAFPALVAKLTRPDTTPFSWPSEAVRAITAPTLIVLGDSDGIRPEHAVAMFRLRGGGVFGDVAGLPAAQLAVLPGTTHVGLLDRAEWLLPILTAFLDAPQA
jgi:pimeloyl-ACP methyl ester carboxylesterase